MWCGTELAPWYEGLFCCAAHREKQRLHRRKIEAQTLQPCPKPFKVAYAQRGLALRKAVEYNQRPYLCVCGTYHLTSKRVASAQSGVYASALAALSEEMLVGVSA